MNSMQCTRSALTPPKRWIKAASELCEPQEIFIRDLRGLFIISQKNLTVTSWNTEIDSTKHVLAPDICTLFDRVLQFLFLASATLKTVCTRTRNFHEAVFFFAQTRNFRAYPRISIVFSWLVFVSPYYLGFLSAISRSYSLVIATGTWVC